MSAGALASHPVGPYCLGSLLSISFCELISRSRVHSIRCFQGPYCPAHNVNRCGAMPRISGTTKDKDEKEGENKDGKNASS